MSDKPKTREPIVGQLDTGETFIGCKLDMSHCDHQFGDQGTEDEDVCLKCGTSIWAMAFMEMP